MNKLGFLRADDKRILRKWLPLAFVTTILAGFIYGIAQHSLRTSANDPQIQFAEDIATSLSSGAQPDTLIPSSSVDIRRSLSPFIIVYDSNDKVISSSGRLDLSSPVIPPGVLTYTTQHQEDRLTWQPDSGVRIATVVRSYRLSSNQLGFVLVGRNLREVEKREDDELILTAIGWSVAMLGSLSLCFILIDKSSRRSK